MGTPNGTVRPSAIQRGLAYLPLLGCVTIAVVLGVVVAHVGVAHHRPLVDTTVAVTAVAVLGLIGVPATVQRRRVARRLLTDVDAMSGVEFEDQLANVLRDAGYRVEMTAGSGDFGADLLARRAGCLTVVQAKRYEGTVGIGAVQEVIGARRYYGADEAMVVTNSRLTTPALALAAADDVEVVNREELAVLLAASAARRGGQGPWLLVHQVVAGVVLLGAVVTALARVVGRAVMLLRSGRRGSGV